MDKIPLVEISVLVLEKIGERRFRSSGFSGKGIHRSEVLSVQDPETGVEVFFEKPVSAWRALAVLTEALAMIKPSQP